MTPSGNGYGYLTLTMNFPDEEACCRTVHSLVMEVHGPEKPSDDAMINHINHDKTDNRLENLEWVTELENRLHSAVVEYVDRHGVSDLIDRIYDWI